MTSSEKQTFLKEARKEAFNRYLQTIDLSLSSQNLEQVLLDNTNIIVKSLSNKKPKKVYLLVEATFKRPSKNEELPLKTLLSTKPIIVLNSTPSKIHHLIQNEFHSAITKEIDDVVLRGSGFSLQCIDTFTLAIARYQPLGGSSFIQLPPFIANKKAIINIKNEDNKCFMWSVLAKLYPADKNAERVSKYEQYADELQFGEIKFPVKIDDIPIFESLNDVSVNVYAHDEKN